MAIQIPVLKTISADGTSYGGFVYPEVGEYVEAPDWDGGLDCYASGGLHGYAYGCGCGHALDWRRDAIWLVTMVDPDEGFVDDLGGVGGGCKFRRGRVEYRGGRSGATALLDSLGCADRPVMAARRAVGDHETTTVGLRGDAMPGFRGIAIAGDGGTAAAGEHGTATAGRHGAATAGDKGVAMAGAGGILCWRVEGGERPRLRVAHVGEGGVKPNRPYRWDYDTDQAVEVVD